MHSREGQLSVLSLKSLDLVLLVLALGIAITVANAGESTGGLREYTIDFFATRVKVSNAILCSILLFIWNLSFRLNGLYRSSRLSSRSDLLIKSSKSIGYATVTLLVFSQLAGWKSVSAFTVFVFLLVSWAFLVSARLTVFEISRKLRNRGVNTKSLLILGGGTRGAAFVERLKNRNELGFKVVGFLEDDKQYCTEKTEGVPHLGSFEDLIEIIESGIVDEVVVALPIKSQYARIRDAIEKLEERGVVVHILSDFFPHNLARVQPQKFNGLPLLSVHSTPLFHWRTELKRLIDFSVALTLLVLLFPLFVAVALLIRWDSKGPVLFRQRRFGLNKRRFWVYKFRTMTVDAERRMKEIEHLNEKDGPIFKIKADPRITRVGKFLRKTSIDELPQLMNVLIGDMSLVGPRPLSLRDGSRLEEAWQKRRFSVRPGMTCLWQVSGRSDLSFEEWMRLDLEYIDTWSLQLDWEILVKTVPAVVTAKGAV